MRVLACDATLIDIALPACSDTSGYTATLSRALCTTHELVATYIPPTDDDGARLRLTLPATPLRRGVWTLSVTTPCGCRNSAVFFEGCAPPALPSTHFPTRDTPTPVPVSCAPALQPDLGAANPVLGFDFSRSSDGLTTGIDSEADPAFGEPTAPAPVYTQVTLYTTDAAPLTLVGQIAPVPDALNGSTWTLLDRYGRALATGLLTVTADVATLEGVLAVPLGCGTHYLTLEPTP